MSFVTRLVSAAVLTGAVFSASAAVADNLNRWVTIVNSTSYTIVRFYASHTDMTNWGQDHLGQYVLNPGESFDINFSRDGSGYCIYDFKAVFDDGDELEKYGVNVCEIGRYTYHE